MTPLRLNWDNGTFVTDYERTCSRYCTTVRLSHSNRFILVSARSSELIFWLWFLPMLYTTNALLLSGLAYNL